MKPESLALVAKQLGAISRASLEVEDVDLFQTMANVLSAPVHSVTKLDNGGLMEIFSFVRVVDGTPVEVTYRRKKVGE